MRKLMLGLFAVAGAALTLAATGAAATVTVQIKSTGFSPAAVTVNNGDKVTFKNVDKVDHQVVADNGSFASPILRANQSWTTGSLTTAGTFGFHDALYPKLRGRLTVRGLPPAVTLRLSRPIVAY